MWEIKANNSGKNNYWYGQKDHFAISSKYNMSWQQSFLQLFTEDKSVAVPVMRKISMFGVWEIHVLINKGYDALKFVQSKRDFTNCPLTDKYGFCKRGWKTKQSTNYHLYNMLAILSIFLGIVCTYPLWKGISMLNQSHYTAEKKHS